MISIKVFLTVVPMMLVLLLLLCWIFYSIVRGMVDIAETQEHNRILEMEESQYRKLQAYMEESAAVRHDFRHTLGALDELLSAGDAENATKFLKEYIVSMPKNETIRYCDHPALNAVLNYRQPGNCLCRYRIEKGLSYAQMAERMGVSRQAAHAVCKQKSATESGIKRICQYEHLTPAEFCALYGGEAV